MKMVQGEEEVQGSSWNACKFFDDAGQVDHFSPRKSFAADCGDAYHYDGEQVEKWIDGGYDPEYLPEGITRVLCLQKG